VLSQSVAPHPNFRGNKKTFWRPLRRPVKGYASLSGIRSRGLDGGPDRGIRKLLALLQYAIDLLSCFNSLAPDIGERPEVQLIADFAEI
jgi:hypothetical protein